MYTNETSAKGILSGTKREDKEAYAEFLYRHEIRVMSRNNIANFLFLNPKPIIRNRAKKKWEKKPNQ